MIVATVTGLDLTFENKGSAITDATKYLTIKFTLEEAWAAYNKTAVFQYTNAETGEEEQFGIIMNETSNYYMGNDIVTVPWEVIKVPSFEFWIYGLDTNGNRYTSTHGTVEVAETGMDDGQVEPAPTPNQYQQILNIMNTTQAYHKALYDDYKVNQTFDPNSVTPISGVGANLGMEEKIGQVADVLATVLEGSKATPKAVTDLLCSKAESEYVSKMESKLMSRIGEKLGLGSIVNVSFQPAGYVDLQPNTVYILVTPDGSGTLNAFDHETGDPVQISGKVLAVLCGNYGNIAPELNHAMTGIITTGGFQQNIYTVQGEGIQGTLSWEGTAMFATLSNREATETE